jgi:hypothetical protein
MKSRTWTALHNYLVQPVVTVLCMSIILVLGLVLGSAAVITSLFRYALTAIKAITASITTARSLR